MTVKASTSVIPVLRDHTFSPMAPPSEQAGKERKSDNDNDRIANHESNESDVDMAEEVRTNSLLISQGRDPSTSKAMTTNTKGATKAAPASKNPTAKQPDPANRRGGGTQNRAKDEQLTSKSVKAAKPADAKDSKGTNNTASASKPRQAASADLKTPKTSDASDAAKPKPSSVTVATLSGKRFDVITGRNGCITNHEVFSTQVYDVFVGPAKAHYMVHVGVLVQSPPLARLVYSQAKKKKGRVQKTIQLLNESPTAFGLLLSYLYSHQLELPKLTESKPQEPEDVGRAAKMLAKLYVLASKYELEDLQQRVASTLQESGLFDKIPGLEFFELAEMLYPEDADNAAEDDFVKYFKRVAPTLIRSIPEKDLPELLRMVSNGGAYAQAIFLAYNQAVRSAYEPPSAKGGARAEDVGQDDGFSLPPPRKRLRLDGEAPSLQKASAVSKEGEVGMPTRSNVRGGTGGDKDSGPGKASLHLEDNDAAAGVESVRETTDGSEVMEAECDLAI